MSLESSTRAVSGPVSETSRSISPKPPTLHVITNLGRPSDFPSLRVRIRATTAATSAMLSSPPASSPHSLYVSHEEGALFLTALVLPHLNEDTERVSRSSSVSALEEHAHPFAAAPDEIVTEQPRLRHATLFRGHSTPASSVVRVLSSLPELIGPSSGVSLFSESLAPRASGVTSITPPARLQRHAGEDSSQDVPAAAAPPAPVQENPVLAQAVPVVPRRFSWFCW